MKTRDYLISRVEMAGWFLAAGGFGASFAWFITSWDWEPLIGLIGTTAGLTQLFAHLRLYDVSEADESLFRDICLAIPEASVRLLRSHDFWNEFARGQIDPIYDINYKGDDVRFKFRDNDMEAKRIELFRAIDAFTLTAAKETIPESSNWVGVGRRLKHVNPQAAEKSRQLLNESARNCIRAYDVFVSTGIEKFPNLDLNVMNRSVVAI